VKLDEERAMNWRNEILANHDSATSTLILNVETGTAAAWKAHVTRGTYKSGVDIPESLFQDATNDVTPV
jgi:hypothetical protein